MELSSILILLANCQQTCMSYPIAVCTDGQRNCLKHAEFYFKNKFEKLVHLVGFIVRTRERFHALHVVYKIASPFVILARSSLAYFESRNLLTPWCRVLLGKLTGLQLVKKFPEFHGTRRFITALTSVRHMSLSWASPIQFIYPHPTSWRSIIILSTHLRLGLPSGFFSKVVTPIKNYVAHKIVPCH